MTARRVRTKRTLTERDAATYLRIGVTPLELVRLRWPNVTDADADFILWELTPYPLESGVHDIADAVAAITEPTPGVEKVLRRAAQSEPGAA